MLARLEPWKTSEARSDRCAPRRIEAWVGGQMLIRSHLQSQGWGGGTNTARNLVDGGEEGMVSGGKKWRKTPGPTMAPSQKRKKESQAAGIRPYEWSTRSRKKY